MKRIVKICAIVLLAALLSGCNIRTVDRMYCIPKRSEAYQDLQIAIDSAMVGMEYCAPTSGENQQILQMADLDGDGEKECVLFAKGTGEEPLNVLIFESVGNGYELTEKISALGTGFEQVEYVQIDGAPGLELVFSCQLSDQIVRSVSVYSLYEGTAKKILGISCNKFLTCNLNTDYSMELVAFRAGESAEDNGIAEFYSFENGVMERSVEASMSQPVEKMKRIMFSKLANQSPAVYVASSVDEDAIITDVFSLVNGAFVNVTKSNVSGTSVQTLRNYFVYADDIDDDGVIELPSLMHLQNDEESEDGAVSQQYLVRWYAMMPNGYEVNKKYTFHSFGGGWYVDLEKSWISSLDVKQMDGAYSFFLNDDQGEQKKIFTIYAFTGQNREELAVTENRFLLTRGNSVVYSAQLEVGAVSWGLDEEKLTNIFHLIHQDWRTGET